ncbi:hypothetical protein ACTMU2_05430 [Cupriavidus basilensis]
MEASRYGNRLDAAPDRRQLTMEVDAENGKLCSLSRPSAGWRAAHARLGNLRRFMTPIENTEDRYGAIAIALHWSMALLIIGLVGIGALHGHTSRCRLQYEKDHPDSLSQGIRAAGLGAVRLAPELACHSGATKTG